ncbi:MAG TPA: hypothetical protein VGP72_12610, partial [Planctomycetota bacterium]
RWKKTHAEENEEQQKKRFKIEVVEEDEPKNTAFSNRLDYCSFRSALTTAALSYSFGEKCGLAMPKIFKRTPCMVAHAQQRTFPAGA